MDWRVPAAEGVYSLFLSMLLLRRPALQKLHLPAAYCEANTFNVIHLPFSIPTCVIRKPAVYFDGLLVIKKN